MAVRTMSKNGKAPKPPREAKRERREERPDAATDPIPEGVNPTTGEVSTPPAAPLLRITCPTDIGKVTAKEYSRYAIEAVAIMPDHTNGESVFLTATDGRMVAIVRADFERAGNVEGAGLDAQWLPRDLASGGCALRLAKGQSQTLFGEGLHWVDDDAGVFAEQPGGGNFPPIADLLPESVEGTLCVRLNTKMLATLAKALNDGVSDCPEAVTLFIRHANPGEMVIRPVVAVGNRGIGLLMPRGNGEEGNPSSDAAERWYRGFRRDFIKGRPKPKPTEAVEETLNPAPLDAAPQYPSGSEPNDGEPDDTGTDDGRDAPSDQHEPEPASEPAALAPKPDETPSRRTGRWDSRLTISVGTLGFIDSRAEDSLRAAGLSTLNEVNAFILDNEGDTSKLPLPAGTTKKLVAFIEKCLKK